MNLQVDAERLQNPWLMIVPETILRIFSRSIVYIAHSRRLGFKRLFEVSIGNYSCPNDSPMILQVDLKSPLWNPFRSLKDALRP